MKQNCKHQLKPGVALYLRVNTKVQQNPDNSFEYHRQRIDEALERSVPQFKVVEVYQDILSGKNSQRPNYQQMLSDAHEGMFSHMAVSSIDQLGRSTDEMLAVVDEMMELGIDLIVADSPDMNLTTPTGCFLLASRAGIEKFGGKMLRQRVREAKRLSMREGGWPSTLPDGYKRQWSQHTTKRRSYVVQNPERAKIWREAWDLLLTDQLNLEHICQELHNRGYTRRSGKPWVWIDEKTGIKKYATSQLHHCFHTPFYAGWVISPEYGITRGEVRGHWEPIVTDKEFDRGVAILRSHLKAPAR